MTSTPVDIILPCFNPNEKWHLELLSFHEEASRFFQLNYILVNDGSTTLHLDSQLRQLNVSNIPIQYISYSMNKGKGYALRCGVKESKNDYVVYTDVDFPFTNQSSMRLLEVLLSGVCDVVAGYREDSYYGNKMSVFRRILSKAFRFFLSKILKLPITDTQCGLKGFNKEGKEKFLATTINRYLFDFEFIYSVCKDEALKITTVPVQLKDDIVFSKMKLRILFQETINLISILVLRKK